MMRKSIKSGQDKPTIIRIPVHVVILKPIVLNDLGTTKITVGRGAKATIFEQILIKKNGSGCRAAAITVHVQSHAELHYVALVSGKRKSSLHITRTSCTEASGKIHWHIIILGGNDDHHDLVSELTGADAQSSVDLICAVRGSDRQSISVRNVFSAPRGSGEIVMKCVAQDQVTVSLKGMIEIGERGRGTETHLTQDVLMLDPSAAVDAVPALEIRTNDVKASHSAAITKVSPEHLFYLQSRGIPEAQARRMFVEGFLEDRLRVIPDERIRRTIAQAVERVL